jgi:hypothetical protein
MRQSESDFMSRSGTGNGLFNISAAVMHADFSYAELSECRGRFIEVIPARHEGYFGWTPKPGAYVDSIDEVRPLLVTGHERFHYEQTMSTPVGLLLWRLLNCMADDIMYLVTLAGRGEEPVQIGKPFVTWLFDGGAAEIVSHHPDRAYTVQETVLGLAVTKDFLAALDGQSALSMWGFVELANQAFEYVAMRCGLPAPRTWSAYDLDADSYLPAGGLTTSQVIEGSARVWEVRLLQAMNASAAALSDWHEMSVFGDYKPVYDLLLRTIGSPQLSLMAAEQALLGPIDVAGSGAGAPGTIYVEDVLPAWRLARLLARVGGVLWPGDSPGRRRLAQADLARLVPMTTPRHALAELADQPLNTADGWFADVRRGGATDEEVHAQYRSFMMREIQRGFRLRLEDPLAFLAPAEPDVFQPVLEIYSDSAFFHDPPTNPSPFLPVRAYTDLMRNTACLALLTDGDMSDFRVVERATMDRFAEQEVRDMIDAGEFVRQHMKAASDALRLD